MKIDAAKFKKISSDDSKTVLKHEDGHEITIAHSRLKPLMKKQLDSLPMMADGGEVDGEAKYEDVAKQAPSIAEPKPSDYPEQPPESLRRPSSPTAYDIGKVDLPQAQAQEEKPPMPQVDPDTQKIRDIYNQKALLYGAPKEITARMQFGPSGEPPARFDKTMWDEARKQHEVDQEVGENRQAQQISQMQELNKSRIDAGLSPLIIPPMLGSKQAIPATAGALRPPNAQLVPQDQGQQPGSLDQGKLFPQYQNVPNEQLTAASIYETGKSAIAAQQEAERQQANLNNQLFQGMNAKIQQIDVLAKEAAAQKINPKHYMENQGAVGKVASAIGLILGGIGGGLTHQENPAMRFLNAQIDRDVNSQHMNMQNKQTLLGHYNQELGDMRAAAAFAKASQLGIYANAAEQMGNASADHAVKARALQLKANLQQQMLPLVQKAQVFHMIYGKQPGGQDISPESKLLLMKNSGMVDDKTYEQGNKEIGKASEVEKLREGVTQSFNNISSKVLGGAFSPNDTNSAKQAYAGPLAKAGEGRFNLEESQNQIAALLPQKLDSKKTIENKRQRLSEFMDSLYSTPTLNGLQISVKRPKAIMEMPHRGQ